MRPVILALIFSLLASAASANYLSDTGVLLPDKGSACDVGEPTPYKIVEYPYDIAVEIASSAAHHLAREVGFPGKYDGVALIVVPRVSFWNGATQELHDDLVKHGVTHYVLGCRNWH